MRVTNEMKSRWARLVLLTGIVTVGGWLIERLMAHSSLPEVELELQRLQSQTYSSPEPLETLGEESKARVESFQKANLIVPPPEPPQKPALTGIFSNEAFLGGGWKKVGDSLARGKVVAIGVDYVRIEWDGQEEVLWLGEPRPDALENNAQKPVRNEAEIAAEEQPPTEEQRPRRRGREPGARPEIRNRPEWRRRQRETRERMRQQAEIVQQAIRADENEVENE